MKLLDELRGKRREAPMSSFESEVQRADRAFVWVFIPGAAVPVLLVLYGVWRDFVRPWLGW